MKGVLSMAGNKAGMLATGKTQQQVADEIGWSREKVKNYASLEKIAPIAWDLIGTEFQKTVPVSEKYTVPKNGTTVPITENLLRNILSLTEYHQHKIISELVSGKIKPAQVKHLSTTYAEASRPLAEETGRSAEAIRKHMQRGDGTGQLSSYPAPTNTPTIHPPQAKQKPIGFNL